jgi:CubicO group peptidase (beta-lactamase class C family)
MADGESTHRARKNRTHDGQRLRHRRLDPAAGNHAQTCRAWRNAGCAAYLVARRGEVQVEVVGTKAFGDTEPMSRDAIFRIASLSKPITAATAMVLVDDGTLTLDASIERWLPELANRRVLRGLDAALDDTVPARRAITVEDLLTSRPGFGVIPAMPDTYPIQRAEAERELRTMGPPWPPTPHDTDAWLAQFGELPLVYQPGEVWLYNSGIHVLGMLIERAAERSLGEVMQERLFAPLDMTDTAFSVPADKLGRFTTAYSPDPASGDLSVLDPPDGMWSMPPVQANGAGWLVSTIDDMWAFAQLLANGGEHGGRRIVSERAVSQMTTNQLTIEQRSTAELFLGGESGWGFGMAAPVVGQHATGRPRGYGWNGGTGTTWYTDPDSGLTGILLTQRAMTSPEPPAAFVDFWEGAYAALAS